jgi:MFS family permease
MRIFRAASTGDNIWLLQISTVLLLSLLPHAGYVVSLPFIQTEWDMSNTQAGIVFSVYAVANAVSSLILVPLADRTAPERMMVAGIGVMTAGNLLFPLVAYGPLMAGLLRFIAGSGHIVVYLLGIRLVSQRFSGRNRGSAVGLFVGVGYAGITVSYTLMGQLLDVQPSWRSAYLITSVAALMGLFLALIFTRQLQRSPDVVKTDGLEEAATVDRARPSRGLALHVLRDRSVLLVIIAYALHTAELYLARLWLPLLLGAMLIQHGRTPPEATSLAGTLSGLMFMTGIVGVFTGGILSDRFGRPPAAILIFAIGGICSFLIGWLVGAPPFLMIASGFVYGLITAADSAIYSTAAIELSPPDRIASVQAIQSFIAFAVGAVVPVAAGAILDLADAPAGWGWAFSFNGLLAVLGVFTLISLRRRLPRRIPGAPAAAHD